MSSASVEASRSSARYRTADGQLVFLEAPGFDLGGLWDSTIRIAPRKPDGKNPDQTYMREFHLAPRGNYDYVIERVLDAEVVQVVEAQGGQFLIAVSRRKDLQGLALWRGRWHEIATYLLPSQRGVGSAPLDAFAGLTFTDTPEGLLVAPPRASGLSVNVMDVCTNVTGVGDLELKPASKSLRSIPAWSGAKVTSGEVWQIDVTQESDTKKHRNLFLAAPSAVVTIAPNDPTSADMARPLSFLESVTSVSWTRS